jgi:hypothetical protein
MDPVTDQVKIDRQAEREQAVSSLDQVLSEVGLELEPEKVEVLKASLLEKFRSKDEVDRISKTSYAQGLKAAAQKPITDSPKESPAPLPAVVGGDEASQMIAKTLASIEKKFEKKFEDLSKQNETLQREIKTREVSAKVEEIIKSSGLEDPQSILLLARQTGVDFALDYGGVPQVVRADDPSMPLNGAGTYTSAEDFFQQFKNTDIGKRFTPVSRSATEGAGFTGAKSQPVVPGPFSPERQAEGRRALGIE